MKSIHNEIEMDEIYQELKIDCNRCCGLCCVALYYFKTDGFPSDKAEGTTCTYLNNIYECTIHRELESRKLKGCMAYDCMGAGQKVTQKIYPGTSWSENKELASEIYAVFDRIHELHHILWYLVEAKSINGVRNHQQDLMALIEENHRLTAMPPKEILSIEIDGYRSRANQVFKKVWEEVQTQFGKNKKKPASMQMMGKNLKHKNLDGVDFSMCLLIASNFEGCSFYGTNFLGADIRDANLADADLHNSIFLTQMQINSAKGNNNTKLPPHLVRPTSW